MRVGYGIASPSIIGAMDAVREPFNVNTLAQAAAAAALGDRAFLNRTRRMVRDGRGDLMAGLSRLGVRAIPSVTNFLLLDVGPAASRITKALVRQGIIVRDMSAWHLDGCLRVTIGTPSENRRFIHALKNILPARGVS